MVLSDHFAASYWCTVETNLANTRLMGGVKNCLILILLSDIKTRNMTPTLRSLMTTQSYLPWSNGVSDQERFWKRLGSALKRPRGRRGEGEGRGLEGRELEERDVEGRGLEENEGLGC